KVESKWAMNSENQFGKLTPCKDCEISPVKTKTKHCFMERNISKLWAIQVDCKNRIHGRVECFWKNKYLGAESNDKKYPANQIAQEENEVSLEEVTKVTLKEVEKKTECQTVLVGTYWKKVHETYIVKKLPLTIITEKLKNRAEIKKKEGTISISNRIMVPLAEKEEQSRAG
ncbi:6996_t:CDS:2, partial [Gigaspora rosea]